MIRTRTYRDHVVIPCPLSLWGSYRTVWSEAGGYFTQPLSGFLNYSMTRDEAEVLVDVLEMNGVYACVASIKSLRPYV